METETLVTNQEQQVVKTTTPTQLEQKQAVYQFVLSALPEGSTTAHSPLKSLVTKEVRKVVRVKLFEGIKAGTIKYKPLEKTDGELKKYCSSLINNWLKKDDRFN